MGLREYGGTSCRETRHYIHDQQEAEKYGVAPSNFTD